LGIVEVFESTIDIQSYLLNCQSFFLLFFSCWLDAQNK